jgi:hypothetical protein
MTKTTKKSKGNRSERVTYDILYYTATFFYPGSETVEDGGVNSKSGNMVRIPVKIQADAGETRSNVTTFEMRR